MSLLSRQNTRRLIAVAGFLSALLSGHWLARADDCEAIKRLGREWDANLSKYSQSKEEYSKLTLDLQLARKCKHREDYLDYLINAETLSKAYEANRCPSKWSKVECDKNCFTQRVREAREWLKQNNCSLETKTQKTETATYGGQATSASCSDITGTGGPAAKPAACDNAKKLVKLARDERKKYPDLAQKRYREVAAAYRDAGDHQSAAVALREAVAEDVTPFVQAEAEAANKTKNIVEGANQAQLAKKIVDGAFESGSCADILVGANYYLQAAIYYHRADQYSTVNAILEHKNKLQDLVDDFKRRGLCNRKVAPTERISVPTALGREQQLPAEKCKVLLDHVKRVPEFKKTREGSALLVEWKARGCVDPRFSITQLDCDRALTQWHFISRMPEVEMRRLLTTAGCKVSF